ncbi:type 2 isopentenyl-diphosphate Delta-isomerase [Evansella sp. AB-P1]|uniref:type 2 isopentenyl-diphosphate Delta-isomerase n=1 Tax=Evansella sp. AB-P1 TaxID=3037653 RepID=UPI00241BFB22|nr:type 2 isopentenyl-diphosphate Delta-isomerase [Evansella sp. AB-P1]MDG5787617.1 type 2 isopentenyl-diphosphate Delta-isomerase [Evansella sp. AB-P1]
MTRSKRKLEHIDQAIVTGQNRDTGFDDIRFIHQSLPDTNVSDVSLDSSIGELRFSSPVFINAMTGGGGKETENINSKLSEIANSLDIPMAVGSQMAAIKDNNELKSYEVVRKNHNGLLFANIGSEATVDEAKRVVDIIEANALQIHLNVIQELVMPEGDREFKGALERIGAICEQIQVPVIVKEVGFGMSKETVWKLSNVGASAVDIGGYGGTNFSKIENRRRNQPYSFFNDWGIPTAVSIVEAKHSNAKIPIIASGGIQNALDIAKSISLGASATGIAGAILKLVIEEGVSNTVLYIQNILKELTLIMTAIGAQSISKLQETPILIQGSTKEWLSQRNVQIENYANRPPCN